MFYLLAMQWIPFWGSDGTLSMGIFISEGGRNWGWRKTVGKQINTNTTTRASSLRRKVRIRVVQTSILLPPRPKSEGCGKHSAHRGTIGTVTHCSRDPGVRKEFGQERDSEQSNLPCMQSL